MEGGAPAAVTEPSPCQGTSPPESEPLGTGAPGAAHLEVSDEVPTGFINDDLLEEQLCKKMLDSLKCVYNHHKVMLFLMTCNRIIVFTNVLIVSFLV